MIEAKSVFRRMEEAGVLPNLYAYNSMIDGYYRSGNVKQALVVYHQMLIDGIPPNVVTFSILIDALCGLGKVVAARNFLVNKSLALFLTYLFIIH